MYLDKIPAEMIVEVRLRIYLILVNQIMIFWNCHSQKESALFLQIHSGKSKNS